MKIGIMGAQGTGKTTLAKCLWKKLGGEKHVWGAPRLIKETARECPHPVNRDMTVASQQWIMAKQMAKEADLSVFVDKPGFHIICDRTVLDPVVYAFYMADKMFSEYCTTPQNGFLKAAMAFGAFVTAAFPLALYWLLSYDHIYWCRPNGRLPENDGFRDVDRDFQMAVDNIFEGIVEQHKDRHPCLKNIYQVRMPNRHENI